MAHVQKRNGRWQARYRGPDRRERSATFDRKVDAERWLSTQTADVTRGAWVDPALGRMTFREWCKRWERGLHNLRPTTLALNTGVVRNHLLPRFGDWPLAAIGTTDVKAMVVADLERGMSSSAVRRHVIVLRGVLASAMAEGRLGRNACEGVKLPPESTRDMRVLEPAQVRDLADAISPTHYRPLVLTAAYVGLRWGELAGLRTDAVDVLRRTIHVREQLIEVGGKVSFGPPKTRAGSRVVTMPSAIAEILGEHMGSDPVRSSGMVFPTVSGSLMRRSNFRTVWKRAVVGTEKRPGVFAGTELESLVFHECRHTAAALAIAQGAHPLTIKDRLGHSSISVTMDVYGHLFPAQDAALAEALDGVLRDSLAERSRTVGHPVAHLSRSEA